MNWKQRAEAAEAHANRLEVELDRRNERIEGLRTRLHQATEALEAVDDFLERVEKFKSDDPDECHELHRQVRQALAALAGEDDGQKPPQREGDYL